MKYEDFLAELRGAGLSGRAFARLLDLHPNTISNYKAAGEVPSHLGVIAALIHTMKDAGIDYLSTMAKVPRRRKAKRGVSIGTVTRSK